MDDQTQVERYKTLDNGAVYDFEKKRIVKGATLTSAQAAAMAQQKNEKRRQAIIKAANSNDSARQHAATFGEYAFIAAIAEAQMRKATDSNDPKSTEAARWILQESGEGIKESGDEDRVTLSEVRGLLRDIAAVARSLQPAEES